MKSVLVHLAGNVTDDDIEAAQDLVRDLTGGEAKVYPRSLLAPHEVYVGGFGEPR